MDRLPTELLAQVSTYLDSRSLRSFSHVSQCCRSASFSEKFRLVTIPSSGDALEECKQMLHACTALRHVRHLQVSSPDSFERARMLSVDREEAQEIGDNQSTTWRHARSRDGKITVDDTMLDLVSSMLALTELSWACQAPIPISVIDHLEKHKCQLHMLHFNLQSLRPGPGIPVTLSDEDRRLATSPCLTTVIRRNSSRNLDEHHLEAIMDLMLGAAPNLREVALSWDRSIGSSRRAPPQPKWQWPQGHIASSLSRGSLTKLEVKPWRQSLTVQKLSLLTDLSQLRWLELPWCTPDEEWEWLTSSRSLVKLERFVAFSERHCQAMVDFLLSLSTVKDLDVSSDEDVKLEQVVLHCGHRLQRLICHSMFLKDDMLDLMVETCQEIEQLDVGIYRRQGAVGEATALRRLAQLPRLRQLCLNVRSAQFRNVERPRPTQPLSMSYSCFDNVEDDRAALILKDLACDQELARRVWEIVMAARSPYAVRLEFVILAMSLRLDDYPCTHCFLHGGWPLENILTHVTPAWKCVGDLRAGFWHECAVIGWDVAEGAHNPSETLAKVEQLAKGQYAAVLNSVWPDSRHRPFAEAWHSFPIVGDE